MERKRNNPTWCCDQIEEKIKDYKISLTEIEDEEVKRQLERLYILYLGMSGLDVYEQKASGY